MIEELLGKMTYNASNDDRDNRRTAPRRAIDSCIGIIDGQAYPVVDWSDGGVLMNGDDKLFSLNQFLDFTLKFKLTGKILDVTHSGKIVRKAKDKFAVQFDPVSRDIGKKFQTVVDDCVAREFVDSQLI